METNPGIYGKALASWMAERLRTRGISVDGGVIAEDFGRCVMVRRRPFKLWVACANAEGSTTRWQTFISLETSLANKLFRRADPAPDLQRLRENYRAIVEEVPGIADIVWERSRGDV